MPLGVRHINASAKATAQNDKPLGVFSIETGKLRESSHSYAVVLAIGACTTRPRHGGIGQHAVSCERPMSTALKLVDEDVWLGVNVVVLKDAVIDDNAIIVANGVITRDVSDNVLFQESWERAFRELQ